MDEMLADDARLEAALAGLRDHLVTPVPQGWAGPARRWRAVGVAAVVAAVVAVTGVAVTPVRRAVAEWLGIGSTRVQQVPAGDADGRGLPVLRDGAVVLEGDEAAAVLGRRLPSSFPVLGRPDAVVRALEGGVLLVWQRSATTLWIRPSGDDAGVLVRKLVAQASVHPVSGLGQSALLIEGAHVLETPDRRLAAGRVVLWIAGGHEYRLESDLQTGSLVGAARALAEALAA